jgi:hypothetical protein
MNKIELTGNGVEVIVYDKHGYRKEVKQFNSVNDAAAFWYNFNECDVLPTIWKNGKRVAGF